MSFVCRRGGTEVRWNKGHRVPKVRLCMVQALVEQCAAAGKVADVERCVLRLDLATLDFNQVRPW